MIANAARRFTLGILVGIQGLGLPLPSEGDEDFERRAFFGDVAADSAGATLPVAFSGAILRAGWRSGRSATHGSGRCRKPIGTRVKN